MCDSPENDPFTQNIINHIHPKVYMSLNPDQIQGIREAIFKCRPSKKHLINLRGFIPLIFTRLYFVFILGKDRRKQVQDVELERRRMI